VNIMRVLKSHPILSLVNSYIVDSPQPANISYMWNFGSLLGLCLVIQILTGIFLAMHYSPNVDLAFASVEHIMRDVNYGWAIRYTHANTASFFFICVYLHIARGLYYGSYRSPRTLPWAIGVIILVVMMATAFLGYVLPYGQMSLWGVLNCLKCLFNNIFLYLISFFLIQIENTDFFLPSGLIMPLFSTSKNKIKGLQRIGPHNEIIYSIIFGSLLGDAHAEKRNGGLGTRISFYQEHTHVSYLLWLHSLLATNGYCNNNIPQIQTRLGSKGVVRKVLRIHTWTYTSFNFIHDLFYVTLSSLLDGKKVKRVPQNISAYLTPLALAIWIMDDGTKVSKGLKLCTNSYSYEDCLLLLEVLHINYKLKASVQSAGVPNQYNVYIWKESMPSLREIISPYIIPEMKYKILE